MAGLLDILNGGEASGEEKLDAKEQREFDEITYDKIQAISDPKKLARLEAYMRREEFFTTADVARARLQSLTSSGPEQEAPVIPSRKSSDSELDQVLKELKSWEASVKGADKALKQDSAGPSESEAAPIRRQVGGKVDNAGLIEEPETTKPKNVKEVVEKAKRMKDSKDVRSGAEYYKKWDKVADQLQEEEEGPTQAKKDEKEKEGQPAEEPKEDEDRSSTAMLSAAAADRLVEAAWKKPAVEREWLATREREKGNELFKSQEYRSSLASYSLALRLQPTSAAAYANRAAAHLKLKQYKEACADCDKALEIDPQYLKAVRRRGTARLDLGQCEGAVSDLETAQKLDPESQEIADLLRKARSKLDEKKPLKRMQIEEVEGEEKPSKSQEEKAEEKKSSTNGGPLRNSMDESVGREETEGQASKGDQSVENKSEESIGGSQKAEPKPEAQKESSTQKEIDVNKLAEEWREKGNVLYKRGDTTGAAACYTHSLTYSKTAAALSNRAMCWNKVGKYKEAEEDASAAMALDRSFVKAYHRRAAARRGLNKKQLSMEDYKVVLQAMPTNAALQEEVRSLQEELDETMYIPPRKGAMVIEEVAEEEPQPAVRPAPSFPSPQLEESLEKPAAFDQQKQESQPLNGVRASSGKAQRVSTTDASDDLKAASVDVSVSQYGEVECRTGEEAQSGKTASKKIDSAGTGESLLPTHLLSRSEPSTARCEPSIGESDGLAEAEKAKEEGNRLFKQRDVSGALKHYTRAIELQPENAAFYGNRAMCYLQLKRYADVIADASKAIELDPQYTKAYYRRALATKGLGQYESALEDLKFVQEKLPKDKQVAEEVLAITDLYMRRFENLVTPSIAEQGASPAAKTTPPQVISQQPLAEASVETQTEAAEKGEASKRGLPSWLKEQLEEQVKQGGLRVSDASAEGAPLDSEERKDQPNEMDSKNKPSVRASIGSLTDDVFEGAFGSKQSRPAFSVGSFDKKASPSKTSPRGKRRASPRSVVSSVTEIQTPPNEIEEEGSLKGAEGSLNEQDPPTKKQPRVEEARIEEKIVEEPLDLASTAKIEAASKALPAVPRSALEFERACSSLQEPERIAAYLQTFDPSSYPSILKENLSALLMTHVAKALPFLPVEKAADVMTALSDVSRFALVWMLLPAATKKDFAAVLKGLKPTSDATPPALERLRKAFRT